jgi:hypothetical protein
MTLLKAGSGALAQAEDSVGNPPATDRPSRRAQLLPRRVHAYEPYLGLGAFDGVVYRPDSQP